VFSSFSQFVNVNTLEGLIISKSFGIFDSVLIGVTQLLVSGTFISVHLLEDSIMLLASIVLSASNVHLASIVLPASIVFPASIVHPV